MNVHHRDMIPEFIQHHLDEFILGQREALAEIGEDFAPLIDEASMFLRGGKRLRAQFLMLGHQTITPVTLSSAQQSPEATRLLDAACALELFHAAALVHDDIIDRSDARRGRPSSHKTFAQLHRSAHYRGDADHFGVSAAILLGDILQSWADECMHRALDAIPDRVAAATARQHFNRMRSEVAVGQYLDVLEEQHQDFAEHRLQLERSTRVLVYKSAKYSVQAPILIGASMAGASEVQLQALADFGLPVGVAFQLRDDLLGVFGNEDLTGKPTGDDLTEGKRTVLVTLARESLPQGPKRVFDELHGDPKLDQAQIRIMQDTIHSSGARDRVESMIMTNVGIAREALTEAQLEPAAVTDLIALAEFAATRDA